MRAKLLLAGVRVNKMIQEKKKKRGRKLLCRSQSILFHRFSSKMSLCDFSKGLYPAPLGWSVLGTLTLRVFDQAELVPSPLARSLSMISAWVIQSM